MGDTKKVYDVLQKIIKESENQQEPNKGEFGYGMWKWAQLCKEYGI